MGPVPALVLVGLVLSSYFYDKAFRAIPDAGQQKSIATDAPVKQLTTEQIAAAASGSVVTITTFDRDGKRLALGSGFLVKSDGVVVTNWHVMLGASKATVSLRSGESFDRVSFLDGDESADVVVLKIPTVGLRAIPTTPNLPEVGSRVVVLGSPLGLAGSVSEGIVSAVRLVDGKQMVQITAAISPGSSGGPVIDGAGRAFAVATESLEGKGIQQLNFAVPVKYAIGLLSSQLAERPLAGSPVSSAVAARSDFALSTGDFEAWLRPGPTAEPVPSLTGQYVFVSRSTSRLDGRLKGKSLGTLVLGDAVGLWLITTDKGVQVLRAGPLTRGAGGTVALTLSGSVLVGYQTTEGFWVSLASPESDDVLELQAKRFSSERTEDWGVYSVNCSTTSFNSFTVAGGTYPIVDKGPEWKGEAAIIVADNQIHLDLVLRNDSGGSVQANASGPIKSGTFDLTGTFDTKGASWRLAGDLNRGRLRAQWIHKAGPSLRFEGILQAERK